jgi:hypothetical protein
MYAGHTERLHEVITTMDAIIKRYFFIEPLKLTIIHDEMIKIKWFFLSNFKFKKRNTKDRSAFSKQNHVWRNSYIFHIDECHFG